MRISRIVPSALGGIAVSSGAAILSFEILFAATLHPTNSSAHLQIVAIVASTLGLVTVVLCTVLLGRHIRYRNGAHIQDFGVGRLYTYSLAAFGGLFGLGSAVVSAVLLGMMKNELVILPSTTPGPSTKALVTAAFIIWAIALVSQAVFISCMVVIQRQDFQQQIQPYREESKPRSFPEMKESSPRTLNENDASRGRGIQSVQSSPPSSGRSRAGSDTKSFRSSLSQVVRPITSKSKLIQPNGRSPYRPQSVDSDHRETIISIEDGFDSWDTSAVDPHSRQAVESASPTPQRFLETIPASPTGSRSPSPGFPLEPPKNRKRSRSYSPANSHRDLPRTARTTSPTESSNSEAHIHPLFRADSPAPPEASPNTIILAAPNGGQIISDRASIRSIHRMRSGSLPTTPLMHTPSLDSIRRAMEREELDRLEVVGTERTLTPPIPDFILNGGPRNSMHGYVVRKGKTKSGMGKLGEEES